VGRYNDWKRDAEVQNIMEEFVEKFPEMFEGFDPQKLHVIHTQKKKRGKLINLRQQGYPQEVFVDRPYIVEVLDVAWSALDIKRKRLAVFHVMCSIPQGGFDPTSKFYAKKAKPDIQMFTLEFAACGGVPNWMENPAAKDPLESTSEEMSDRVSRMSGDREAIPSEEEAAVPEKGPDGVVRTPVKLKDITGPLKKAVQEAVK
jgi:hypothetical protein